MEQYEIYNGRKNFTEWKEIVFTRFKNFRGTGYLFECAFFQNIMEDLILFHERSDEDINAEIQANAETLVNTLKSFGVETKFLEAARGPSVTRYELQPAMGCTEPISIAYAAAKARAILQDKPLSGKLEVSGNIVKNAKSVTVRTRAVCVG